VCACVYAYACVKNRVNTCTCEYVPSWMYAHVHDVSRCEHESMCFLNSHIESGDIIHDTIFPLQGMWKIVHQEDYPS